MLLIKARNLAAMEMAREKSKFGFKRKKARALKTDKPRAVFRKASGDTDIPYKDWPVWFKHHGITYRWSDGDWIRAHQLKGTEGVAYVDGGHHWVYPWIPKDEIWVERNMRRGPRRDPRRTAEHERIERHTMHKKHADYEEAHGLATAIEGRIRRGEDPEELLHLVRHLIHLAEEVEELREAS